MEALGEPVGDRNGLTYNECQFMYDLSICNLMELNIYSMRLAFLPEAQITILKAG